MSLHGDSFFMIIYEGVQQVFAEHHLDLVVLLCPSGQDPHDHLRRAVQRRFVDALFISQIQRHDPRIDFLIEREIPFMALGRSLLGRLASLDRPRFRGPPPRPSIASSPAAIAGSASSIRAPSSISAMSSPMPIGRRSPATASPMIRCCSSAPSRRARRAATAPPIACSPPMSCRPPCCSSTRTWRSASTGGCTRPG